MKEFDDMLICFKAATECVAQKDGSGRSGVVYRPLCHAGTASGGKKV